MFLALLVASAVCGLSVAIVYWLGMELRNTNRFVRLSLSVVLFVGAFLAGTTLTNMTRYYQNRALDRYCMALQELLKEERVVDVSDLLQEYERRRASGHSLALLLDLAEIAERRKETQPSADGVTPRSRP